MNTERHIPAILNADDDERFFSMSDALAIENCRVGKSLNGKNLRIENIPSTQELSGSPLVDGNTCVGSCVDTGRRRILYACYNETDGGAIYCYDIPTGNFYTVLKASQVIDAGTLVINFGLDKPLDRNMRVIGDLLVWANGSSPKCLNIDAGINSNHPGTYPNVYSYKATENLLDVFTLIKKPPISKIIGLKMVDDDFGSNFIEYNAFQFAYFFTYYDGQQSALSPWSDLINCNNNINLNETYNRIDLDLYKFTYMDFLPYDLQMISLCVRYGNTGKTFIIKTWDKRNPNEKDEIESPSLSLKYSFYNNEIGAALDDVQSVNNFDNVPISAKTLEVAKNRVFLGNVVNGYTSPTVTSLSAEGFIPSATPIPADWQLFSFESGTVDEDNHFIPSPHGPYTTVYILYDGKYYDYGNLTSPFPSTIKLSQAINVFDSLNAMQQSLWVPGMDGYFDSDPDPLVEGDIVGSVSIEPTFGTSVRQMKSNSTYVLGITFFDRYRRKCGIVTSPDAVVKIPEKGFKGDQIVTGLKWSLSSANGDNEIPEWAYYYQICMTKNQTFEFFIDTKLIQEVYYVSKDSQGAYDFTGTSFDANKTIGVCFDLSSLISDGIGYTFTEGDMVTVFEQVDLVTAPVVRSLRVLDMSGKWLIATPVDLGTLPVDGDHFFSLEIYTPYKASDNEPFYEISPCFNIYGIGAPGRGYSFVGGTIDGDVYYITSNVFTPRQAMSPNKLTWMNWERDLGWVNIKDTIGQQDLATTIAFSDTFIPGSRVNGINKFQALNVQSLTSETGNIQKLILTNKIAQEQGTVMLCICENEPLSIYLGETQLVSNEGNAYVAQSVGVIGTINALRGNYGTLHPESVVDFLGEVYWFDIKHGTWIMYSANGANPVNYKMDTYFQKYRSRYISQKLGLRIISCVDPVRNYMMAVMPATESIDYPYIIPSYGGVVPGYATTIKSKFDPYDGQGKMLMLSVPDNAWRHSIGIVPEWLEFTENEVYGFVNGVMHQFEAGEGFNSFLGVQLPARIAFPMSQTANPVNIKNAIKELFSISVEGNRIPDYVLAYAKYPNEQVTDLASTDLAMNGKPAWSDINGIQYAGFLKDRLSPNVSGSPEVKMYSGDYIRSVTPLVLAEFKAYNELLIVNALNLNYGITSGHTT